MNQIVESKVYSASLAAFLAATDEKHVFATYVQGIFASHRIKTFLDIGSGDGTLAMKLKRTLRGAKYTAVEPNPLLASQTKSLMGGAMVVDVYPSESIKANVYDAILSSYSLPIETQPAELFVAAIGTQLSKHGVAVVITYDEQVDQWSGLRDELSRFIDIGTLRTFDEADAQTRERNAKCQLVLEQFGQVQKSRLISRIVAKSSEEFCAAISFLLTAGEPMPLLKLNDVREHLIAIAETYKVGDKYELQMGHVAYCLTRVAS